MIAKHSELTFHGIQDASHKFFCALECRGQVPYGAKDKLIVLGTRLLAGDKSGQHGKHKRAKTDVPGPSRPHPSHPRHPTEPVDPPRRRERLKSPPKRIRRSKIRRSTYQVVQLRRSHIGRIGCIVHVVHGLGMIKEKFRGPKCEDDGTRAIEDDLVRCSKSATLGEAQLPY